MTGSYGAQVVLATCAELPDGDQDDLLAVAALAELGVAARFAEWDDPGADFTVPTVVRSTWDYTPRRDEFLAWAAGVPVLHNPAEVLAWNSDKTYLDELAAAGLDVVPSRTLLPGCGDLPERVAQAALLTGEVVVKPTVSAGSKDTVRHSTEGAATAHAQELLAAGRAVMLQPYLPTVDTDGETGVVVLDGDVSHAFRKGPLLRPDAGPAAGLFAEEEIRPRQADGAQLRLVEHVLAYVTARFPGCAPLLYARFDMLPGPDGAPVLLELELVEPSLFLATSDSAPERFAAAVAGRVR